MAGHSFQWCWQWHWRLKGLDRLVSRRPIFEKQAYKSEQYKLGWTVGARGGRWLFGLSTGWITDGRNSLTVARFWRAENPSRYSGQIPNAKAYLAFQMFNIYRISTVAILPHKFLCAALSVIEGAASMAQTIRNIFGTYWRKHTRSIVSFRFSPTESFSEIYIEEMLRIVKFA